MSLNSTTKCYFVFFKTYDGTQKEKEKTWTSQLTTLLEHSAKSDTPNDPFLMIYQHCLNTYKHCLKEMRFGRLNNGEVYCKRIKNEIWAKVNIKSQLLMAIFPRVKQCSQCLNVNDGEISRNTQIVHKYNRDHYLTVAT